MYKRNHYNLDKESKVPFEIFLNLYIGFLYIHFF